MMGHVIGNYKILDKIGEGGMGEVFQGIDLTLGRKVAIKSLRPELAHRQDLVERFRTEAMALARLNHTNLVTLYSFFGQGDSFFMIMEFVQGETLDKVIARSAPMPWDRTIPLFCQALQGIAHAHHLGVIHRDIKPANIILTDTGTLKVLDFGIARLLGTARTATGRFFGTLAYISPEQLRGQDTDARTDVYSLGIVLYEMLTGRVPFTGTSEYELIQAHLEKMPTPLHYFVAQVPITIEKAVMRALAKAPEARFQTVDEFRTALEDGLRATALPPNSGTSSWALPVTRLSEPLIGTLSSANGEKNRRSWLFRLTQLHVLLSSRLNWKHYPGIIVMLLLVSIALGLIRTANTTHNAVLAPAQAGVQPPPPSTTTSTSHQPDPIPVSSVEDKKPLSLLSEGWAPEPKEPRRENKPAPKPDRRTAKGPAKPKGSKWRIIK